MSTTLLPPTSKRSTAAPPPDVTDEIEALVIELLETSDDVGLRNVAAPVVDLGDSPDMQALCEKCVTGKGLSLDEKVTLADALDIVAAQMGKKEAARLLGVNESRVGDYRKAVLRKGLSLLGDLREEEAKTERVEAAMEVINALRSRNRDSSSRIEFNPNISVAGAAFLWNEAPAPTVILSQRQRTAFVDAVYLLASLADCLIVDVIDAFQSKLSRLENCREILAKARIGRIESETNPVRKQARFGDAVMVIEHLTKAPLFEVVFKLNPGPKAADGGVALTSEPGHANEPSRVRTSKERPTIPGSDDIRAWNERNGHHSLRLDQKRAFVDAVMYLRALSDCSLEQACAVLGSHIDKFTSRLDFLLSREVFPFDTVLAGTTRNQRIKNAEAVIQYLSGNREVDDVIQELSALAQVSDNHSSSRDGNSRIFRIPTIDWQSLNSEGALQLIQRVRTALDNGSNVSDALRTFGVPAHVYNSLRANERYLQLADAEGMPVVDADGSLAYPIQVAAFLDENPDLVGVEEDAVRLLGRLVLDEGFDEVQTPQDIDDRPAFKNVFQAILADSEEMFFPSVRDGIIFEPTQAIPGSDEKREILIKRAEQGLPLWHEGDRRKQFPAYMRDFRDDNEA